MSSSIARLCIFAISVVWLSGCGLYIEHRATEMFNDITLGEDGGAPTLTPKAAALLDTYRQQPAPRIPDGLYTGDIVTGEHGRVGAEWYFKDNKVVGRVFLIIEGRHVTEQTGSATFRQQGSTLVFEDVHGLAGMFETPWPYYYRDDNLVFPSAEGPPVVFVPTAID